MTDEAAFLRSICGTGLPPAEAVAARADDTRRLAFADWLEENGQGERAEFVRVQIQRAKDGHLVPRARESELFQCLYNNNLPGHFVPNLDGQIGRASPHAHYSRGFVSALTCSWSDFHRHADAILVRQPIERVKLTTMPGEMDEVFGNGKWTVSFQWQDKNGQPCGQSCTHTIRSEAIRIAFENMARIRWPGIEFELPPDDIIILPAGAEIHAGEMVGIDERGLAVPFRGNSRS